jgi:hypothetical protein
MQPNYQSMRYFLNGSIEEIDRIPHQVAGLPPGQDMSGDSPTRSSTQSGSYNGNSDGTRPRPKDLNIEVISDKIVELLSDILTI